MPGVLKNIPLLSFGPHKEPALSFDYGTAKKEVMRGVDLIPK
jgi:hypothetical protein